MMLGVVECDGGGGDGSQAEGETKVSDDGQRDYRFEPCATRLRRVNQSRGARIAQAKQKKANSCRINDEHRSSSSGIV